MFNPIKAVKTEIHLNVQTLRTIRDAYKYEKMIARSKAHLASIPVTHGVVQVHA